LSSRRSVRNRRCILAPSVGPNDMRELARPVETGPLFSKVWAFTNVLFVAVQTLSTVPKHSKVTADTVALADMDVRIEARLAVLAFPVVRKMDAERNPLRRRIMRQRARRRIQRALSLQEARTDGDLVRVVLIRTSPSPRAGTRDGKKATLLVHFGGLFAQRSPRVKDFVAFAVLRAFVVC